MMLAPNRRNGFRLLAWIALAIIAVIFVLALAGMMR